jgi:hypothetical protein
MLEEERWAASFTGSGDGLPIGEFSNSGTFYENKKGGQYYQEQREKVIERDGGCVACGDHSANTVHHIIPRRKFESKFNAHALDNLVLVCKESCHWKLENMDIETQQSKFHPDYS